MPTKLIDLPNIGKAIASDLFAIGIHHPSDLLSRDPMSIFMDLKRVMGHRHDPCVYYTLLSVEHFMRTNERLPWWKFTSKGKSDLALNKRSPI
jgi:DNA transformation protein